MPGDEPGIFLSHRVQGFHAIEIARVGSDDDAIMGEGGGGDDGVCGVTRATVRFALPHQLSPDHCGIRFKRQNAAIEEDFGLFKPILKFRALLAMILQQNAVAKFCLCHGGDEQARVCLCRQPALKHGRGVGLGAFAQNVGVEQIAGHRSISRAGVNGRSGKRSSPTTAG